MRTTRSSWALLAGATLAVATSICVVDRYGPTAYAPAHVPFQERAHPADTVRPRNDMEYLVVPERHERNRPRFDPPLPDLRYMILYTSPGFDASSR